MSLNGVSQTYFPFKTANQYGIIDTLGKVIIEPSYRFIEIINNNRFWAYKNNGWEYVNNKGENILNSYFTSYHRINDSFSIIQNKYQHGALDTKKDAIVLNPQYEALSFLNNIFIGKEKDSIFYHAKDGSLILGTDKEHRLESLTKRDGLYLLDGKKKAILLPTTDTINWCDIIKLYPTFYTGQTNDSLYIYNNKSHLISKNTITNIKLINTHINDYHIINTTNEVFIINEKEEVFRPKKAVKISPYSQSLVITTNKDNKKGLYSLETKNQAIKNLYEQVYKCGQFIVAKKEGKISFYKKDFKIIATLTANNANVLSGSLIKYSTNRKTGVYNLKSKQIQIKPIYDIIKIDRHDNYRVTTNNLEGIIDRNGKVIGPPVYKAIETLNNQYKCYTNDDKLIIYYLNTFGQVTDTATYNNLMTGTIKIRQKRRFINLKDDNIRGGNNLNGNVNQFISKYNSNTKHDLAITKGWFKNQPDTINNVHNVKWGLYDTSGAVKRKATSIKDVFILDSSLAIIYPRRIKKYGTFPGTIREIITPKIYDYKKYRYRSLKAQTVNKIDLVRGRSVFMGYNYKNFHLYSRDRFRVLDTFSYVSNTFNNQYRYTIKGGKKETCDIKDPYALSTVRDYHKMIFEFDSIPTTNFDVEPLKVTTRPRWKYKGDYLKVNRGKWGVYDSAWNEIVPNIYDKLHPYTANTFIAELNNKEGIITTDSVIFPIVYQNVERLRSKKDSLFKFTTAKSTFNLINEHGILANKLPSIIDYKDLTHHFIGIRSHRGWGLYNYKDHKEITSPQFSKIKHLKHQYFIVKNRKLLGIIDTNGYEIIKPQKYKEIKPLNTSLFKVKNGRFYGVINTNNDTVLPFRYKSILIKGNYIAAYTRARTEIYNIDLVKIYDKKVGFKSLSNDGILSIIKKGKIRLINLSKQKKLKGKFNKVKAINQLFAVVEKKGEILKYSLSSQKIYDTIKGVKDLSYLSDDLFLIKRVDSKKWMITDTNFTPIITDEFRKFKLLDNRFMVYTYKGKKEIFDIKRRQSIQSINKISVLSFKDGLFICKDRHRKNFYIDTNGNQYFYQSFDKTNQFINEKALVKKGLSHAILDKEGGLINKLNQYNKITPVASNLYKAHYSRLHGIVDSKGDIIIPAEYQKITYLQNNWIQLIKDNTITYYNLSNKQWIVK